MADLTITAASVAPGSGAKKTTGTAGAALTAGQVVYLDPTTNTYKLADCDSATAAARSPAGVAVDGAASGQPVVVVTSGPVVIGATVTAGVGYYLSATAGAICPVADLATGDHPVFLGFASSATSITINMIEAGVALA